MSDSYPHTISPAALLTPSIESIAVKETRSSLSIEGVRHGQENVSKRTRKKTSRKKTTRKTGKEASAPCSKKGPTTQTRATRRHTRTA